MNEEKTDFHLLNSFARVYLHCAFKPLSRFKLLAHPSWVPDRSLTVFGQSFRY